MFNVVEAKKNKEEEVNMICAPIVEFFKKYLSVDVSNVEIEYSELDIDGVKILGSYKPFYKNKIFINKSLKGKGLEEEITIVHELNHLCQFQYNMGISLNIDYICKRFPQNADVDLLKVSDIDELEYRENYGFYWRDTVEMDYENKHIEIDSRITSCLYVYEQTDVDNMTLLIDDLFSCGTTENLNDRLNDMPEGKCKDILLDEFKNRKNSTVFDSLSDEDFAFIDELLA